MSSERACYQVRVAEVVTETNQACSLVLDIPADLTDVFAYRPGQFLTVRVPLPGGGSVARCYSLCSSPHAGDQHAVTAACSTCCRRPEPLPRPRSTPTSCCSLAAAGSLRSCRYSGPR